MYSLESLSLWPFRRWRSLYIYAIFFMIVVSSSISSPLSIMAEEPKGDRVILGEGRLKSVCDPIAHSFQPLPPIEQIVVGTLDATSGEFMWNRNAVIRPRPDNPLGHIKDIKDIKAILDPHHIRPPVINLDPRITNLPPGINIPNILPSAGSVVPRGLPGSPGKIPHGHPPNGYIFALPARAGQIDLVFNVVNIPKNLPPHGQMSGNSLRQFSVRIGNRSVVSTNGHSVDILVAPWAWADFTVSFGSISFFERIGFDRPPSLGCFTLEAFPISYVYEPPGDGSSQTYTTINQVGTVLKTFTSTESTGSQPVSTPFSMVSDFSGLLTSVGEAVKDKHPAAGSALMGAGSVIHTLWGESQTEVRETHRVSDEKSLLIMETQAQSLSTGVHLGPGRGDAIHLLIHPVFAWLVVQDDMRGPVYIIFSLLGYDKDSFPNAEELRVGVPPFNQLSQQTRRMILAADPMTVEYRQIHPPPSPEANPAPDQLKISGPLLQFGGSPLSTSVAHTIESSEMTTETHSTTQTTEEVGGWLSYIATNVPHTGTKSLTTVMGTAKGIMTGTTVSVSVTLWSPPPNEGFEVQPYYDKINGTFAFQPMPLGNVQVAGVVADALNRPVPGQNVRLLMQGREFLTSTNAQGQYSFRSRSIRPGNHVLIVGNMQYPLKLEGNPIMNFNLRLNQAPPSPLSTPGIQRQPLPPRQLPALPQRQLPGRVRPRGIEPENPPLPSSETDENKANSKSEPSQ